MTDGKIPVSFPRKTKPIYPCEKYQIEGKHPESCSHMPRRSCSTRFMGSIKMISTLKIGEEFVKRMYDDYAIGKWIVHQKNSADFD